MGLGLAGLVGIDVGGGEGGMERGEEEAGMGAGERVGGAGRDGDGLKDFVGGMGIGRGRTTRLSLGLSRDRRDAHVIFSRLRRATVPANHLACLFSQSLDALDRPLGERKPREPRPTPAAAAAAKPAAPATAKAATVADPELAKKLAEEEEKKKKRAARFGEPEVRSSTCSRFLWTNADGSHRRRRSRSMCELLRAWKVFIKTHSSPFVELDLSSFTVLPTHTPSPLPLLHLPAGRKPHLCLTSQTPVVNTLALLPTSPALCPQLHALGRKPLSRRRRPKPSHD